MVFSARSIARLILPLSCLLFTSTVAPAHAQEAPRLVVFLSVDQMRADYITRYGPNWTQGLKRLVDHGALFVQAAYPYFNTITCAGHATMSTGTFPSTHGMVLNAWYDRETGKTVTCTDDPSVQPIVYGNNTPAKLGVAHSLRLSRATTFSDELRSQAARPPHVVSFSMKPRSAINLAGHAADLVLWYVEGTGWMSSTAYGATKNAFAEKYIASHPVEHDFDTPWTKLLPESSYLFVDDGAGEQPAAGWTATFPHPFKTGPADEGGGARWVTSPMSDAYLGKMAIAALDEFKLGQTPGTDYLSVSFSGVDGVGHAFGPRSHEVQDTLARLDRTIGELLTALDARVGAGKYVVALTGDHGVAPIPEQMKAMNIDAGRVNLGAVTKSVEAVLTKRWGAGKYVAYVAYTDIYFAPGIYDKLKADAAAMQEVLSTIERVEGVSRVLRTDLLPDVHEASDRLTQASRLSYYAGRSGDLYIQPKPYWLMSSAGTTHGTGYLYDQRVPVLFFGAGIKPGKYWGAATPADIAPTLAAICGVTMSRPDGHALTDALKLPLAASSSAPQSTARPRGTPAPTPAGSR